MPRDFLDIEFDAVEQLELAQHGHDIDSEVTSRLLAEAHALGYDNGFQLANRFSEFMQHLDVTISCIREQGGDAERYLPWLYACLAFAKTAQVAGPRGLRGIERAVRAYEEPDDAEALRKHHLAIQVECPHCHAKPDALCRTAGPDGRSKGIYDHAGRSQAALKRRAGES